MEIHLVSLAVLETGAAAEQASPQVQFRAA